MKTKLNKKCPRCQSKVMISLKTCPNCSLNFEKFYSATNKESKIAIREKENHRILMRNGLPSDVKPIPFLLLTIFLGYMGVHHYYVGRWKSGLCYTIFFLIGCVNGVLTTLFNGKFLGELYEIFSLAVLGWGVVLILWILDIIKVIFNRYKVPVSRKD